MKVIFLDVDGVLNDEQTYKKERTPEGYAGVENRFIKNLKYIVDKTGAEIVLSSDWREEWHHNGIHGKDMFYLIDKLKKFDLVISDKTPGHIKGKGYSGRGQEIIKYLKSHKKITEYVVLDDNDFFDFSDAPIKDHVTITVTPDELHSGFGYSSGLTRELAEKAVEILNHEE